MNCWRAFSRAWHWSHAYASTFDWFIALFASVVIALVLWHSVEHCRSFYRRNQVYPNKPTTTNTNKTMKQSDLAANRWSVCNLVARVLSAQERHFGRREDPGDEVDQCGTRLVTILLSAAVWHIWDVIKRSKRRGLKWSNRRHHVFEMVRHLRTWSWQWFPYGIFKRFEVRTDHLFCCEGNCILLIIYPLSFPPV